MQSGQFPGFEEGPINFDCTFKYNVPRRSLHRQLSVRKAIKRTRHHLERDKRSHSAKAESADLDQSPDEDADEAVARIEEDEGEAGDCSYDEPDRSSVASTFRGSSLYSGKNTTDADNDSSSSDDEEHPAFSSAAQNAITNARISAPSATVAPVAIQKILHHPAAQKAKHKWLSLVSKARPSRTESESENQRILPSRSKHVVGQSQPIPKSPPRGSPAKGSPSKGSPLRGDPLASNRRNSVPYPSPSKSASARLSHPGPMTLERSSVNTPNDMTSKLLSPTSGPSRDEHTTHPTLARSSSSKTTPSKAKDRDSDEEDETTHGVYDSSSKQRVPSW